MCEDDVGPNLAGPSDLHVHSAAIATAMEGVHVSFQFRNVDRVIVTFDAGGDVQSITWVSGSGVVVYYGSYTVVGPLGTERWFSAPGQAYSKFRWYTNQQNSKVLERYRRDGWVTRYELRPGTTDTYRPERVFDPGDNEYTYSYYPAGTGGGIDHRIQQIKDWRGTESNFAWPTATHCVISCRRQGLDFPGLTWEFELDSAGRLAVIRLPATTWYEATTGPLLDITQPRNDRRTVTVDYHGYSAGQALVKDVRTHRTPDGSNWLNLLHCEYVLAAGRYRILQQTDRHGGVHGFTYTVSPVNPNLIEQSVYTAPGGTRWEHILDADGRATTITVIPQDDATGRPRAWAQDEAEPQALSWTYQYGACACALPASITHPSGFTEVMTWDAETGNLLTATVPSPTGTGTVTETHSYAAFLDGARPATFQPPAGEASVTYAYQWMSRSGDLAGRRPTEWTVSTSAVVRADGQSLSMASTVYLDSRGRVDAIVGVDGTVFDYQYGAIGTPYQDLFYRMVRAPGQGAYEAELKYTRNELGWVTQVESGPVGKRTVAVHELDPQGRVWRTSTAASVGAAPYVTEVYRDWFENVAVQRTSNLAHDGQAPKYADGTGSARAFVRHEWKFFFERVVESWMDRRPLPDGDDLAEPAQIPDPWMAHYVFQYGASGLPGSVTLPNGSRIRYTHDGYATLYKVEAEKAADTWLELGRQYFDADLMPRKTKQRLEGSTFASTLIRRNHNGQGYPFEFEDPTGKVTTLVFDAHGRVLSTELRENASAPAGARTTLERDELGRVRKTWRHEVGLSGNTIRQHEWRTLYDVRGNVERVDAPLGRVAHYAYDGIGRLSRVRDNLSSVAADCNEVELVWETGRDVPWKQVRRVFEEATDTVPPTGVRKDYVTELDYDLLGRLVERRVRGQDGLQAALTWVYAYDSFGHATKVTDAEGRHSFGTFDAAGRWVEAWRDAASGTPSRILLSAEYVDAKAGSFDTEIAQRDGRGFETRSVYDGAYRLVSTRRPGYAGGAAHVQTQTYDDASRPKTITDGNGSVVTRLYDLAGRLLFNVAQPGAGVSHLATAERFEYDELGRLKDARTDQTASHLLLGSVAFGRDGLGRVSSETFTYFNGAASSSAQVTSGYQFDDNGQLADDPVLRRRVTYPSGLALETKPDAVGRRKELSVAIGMSGVNTGPLTTWQYAATQVMRRTNHLDASTHQVTDHSYDAYRRLTSLQDAVGTPVISAAFAWDKVGNLTKEWSARVDGSVGERFAYDDFGRMTAAKVGVLTSADMDAEPFSAAAAQRTVGYGIDAGNN